MKLLLYVATFIGGVLGAFILFGTLLADSAPQQGAGAAVAVAFVVIPYCMARALASSHQERLLETLVKSVTAQTQAIPPQSTQAQPLPTPPPVAPSPYAPPARNPFAPKVKA